MVRLKLMANRRAAKCQTMNTLHSMQTLARVQAHIRERKMRLSEENQALHKQKQLRREKELEKLKLAEDWVDSPHSKEQFEAKLQKKEEAAIRRERTLAYAYSHQWRSNSSRSKKPAFIDPKQQWCWSWPERWMSTRPWELSQTFFISGKDYRPRGLNYKATSSRVFSRHAPSTPSSVASNDDMRRLLGFQTEQHRRRHSIGSSLCFGDVERKMTKSRFQVPQNGKPKAKKPLMLASGGRRLSGPPKMAGYGKGWL
ncbi:protein IQ-DOMAIN 1-like [Phalaenopsis equestris]|uniref:protein IQ-DOMAIN 1-like n=1 Tax=Phalaenopsis equestris TaxID=78828 RepID=UPI0009E1EE9D|nr:protein IQ-DOMAIN 1-like [Phalaenopsis equestris]